MQNSCCLYETVVKKDLNVSKSEIKFIIYSTDWKRLIHPIIIEKICFIFDLNLKAVDFYGKDKLDYINQKYNQLSIETNSLGTYPFNFIEDQRKFPLISQQEILKHRIHYVDSGGDNNIMLISDTSIDHNTAFLLYDDYMDLIYRNYHLREKDENRFIQIYEHNAPELFDENFLKIQNKKCKEYVLN